MGMTPRLVRPQSVLGDVLAGIALPPDAATDGIRASRWFSSGPQVLMSTGQA